MLLATLWVYGTKIVPFMTLTVHTCATVFFPMTDYTITFSCLLLLFRLDSEHSGHVHYNLSHLSLKKYALKMPIVFCFLQMTIFSKKLFLGTVGDGVGCDCPN
jgi:hypothetical protein